MSYGERDARASSLLNLLQHQAGQRETSSASAASSIIDAYESGGLYPVSTPQPYPPITANLAGGINPDAADDASANNDPAFGDPTVSPRGPISVDALFRNLTGQRVPPAAQPSYQSSYQETPPAEYSQQQQGYSHQQMSDIPNSGSPGAPPNVVNNERQNALLSLLGNVGAPNAEGAQLGPTSNNETQSRHLLDQLFPGSSQSESTLRSQHAQSYQLPPSSSLPTDVYRPSSNSPSHTGPSMGAQQQQQPNQSPSLATSTPQNRNASPSTLAPSVAPTASSTTVAGTSASTPVSGAEQVMDPTRLSKPVVPTSRFEYYSPFDALNAHAPQPAPSGTGSGVESGHEMGTRDQQQGPPVGSMSRKKPVPPLDGPGYNNAPNVPPQSTNQTQGSLMNRPTSPRISELQQEAQQFPGPRAPQAYQGFSAPGGGYESYGQVPGGGGSAPGSRGQSDAEGYGAGAAVNVAPTSLTPTRMSPYGGPQQTSSPSMDPPPVPAHHEHESSGSSGPAGAARRWEETPRAQRSASSASAGGANTAPGRGMRGSPAIANAPTYHLDMVNANPTISAQPGLSAVTPIALLKLENVYSSGTTIAVSSFIAYAMTRGRVRLIARSNGSRALLHLPPAFGAQTMATDMVVSGPGTSYLACVTSDGGLVVWDVPSELDENPVVPVVLHVAAPPATAKEAPYALRLVKWHPRPMGPSLASSSNAQVAGTIAVASDREVYVFNLADALDRFRGEEITLASLATVSSVITVPSPLVGFTFDLTAPPSNGNGQSASANQPPAPALATLSIDSTIMLWNVRERAPFWTGRVPGEGLPSSIDFLDGGLLVGRKQGTVLQFLPIMSAGVAATVKLVMPPAAKGKDAPAPQDEEGIFAHVAYDSRIRSVWVAHSARASLFAIRLAESAPPAPVEGGKGVPLSIPVLEQIIEFPIPMQCINMAILTASPGASALDADGNPITLPSYTSSSSSLSGNPNSTYGPDLVGGGEGYLDSSGNPLIAVASFAMHSGGVDQINIPMSTFDAALHGVEAKLPVAILGQGPPASQSQAVNVAPEGPREMKKAQQPAQNGAPSSSKQQQPAVSTPEPVVRPRSSPPSDAEDAAEANVAPPATSGSKRSSGKTSSNPSKPTGVKEREKHTSTTSTASANAAKSIVSAAPAEAKVEVVGPSENFVPSASNISSKELRRLEDNIHTRFSKLLAKEMKEQQARIDDQRRLDQEAEVSRQQTILQLVSQELSKNTTRLVEQAVKSEIHNAVLPVLETITKNEIKNALGNAIIKGIPDALKTTLPTELERLLLRPEIGAQIARNFSTSVTPLVERQVRDAFSKTLIPAFQQTANNLQMDFAREMQTEIMAAKKELIGWQGESFRNNDIVMRGMDQALHDLTEQVRSLQLQVQQQQQQQVQQQQQPQPQPMAPLSSQYASPGHRGSPSGGLPPQPIQTSSNLQHPLPHQHVSTSSHLRQGLMAGFNSTSALPTLLSQQSPSNGQSSGQSQGSMMPPQPSSWSTQGPVQGSLPQPQGAQQQPTQYQQPQPLQPIPTYATQQQQVYGPPPAPQSQQQGGSGSGAPPPPLQQPQPIPITAAPPIQPARGEDWDDIFLATLQRQDSRQLRDLLARCNPDVIMPAQRELSPIGQAVVLTLIHRLSESLPDLSPHDESLRSALWWLKRSAYTLNPSDPMIETYVDPVLNTSQQILNATMNRLMGFPELQGLITQIQRTLSYKP